MMRLTCILQFLSYRHALTMAIIPLGLPLLSTELVMCIVSVDHGIWLLAKQYCKFTFYLCEDFFFWELSESSFNILAKNLM